jgi:alkyl sulfatase BDS1-like metallo-beta-lactamase superfamily hydrolase
MRVFGWLISIVISASSADAHSQHVSPQAASQATSQANQMVHDTLDFSDQADFADAQRGLIARFPDGEIRDAAGKVVWGLDGYRFLEKEVAPDTVNPSLWRQERLNNIAGLFRVTDGIYQVRGLDLSNMTLIEGQTGLIIMDPLISAETASAALALYRENVGQRPVKAVIYSHSHVDHYGGVKGVVSEEQVRSGAVKVFAPDGFLEHAVSENVYAGTAMSRRAQYMYGALLPKSPSGQVGAGLGKTTSRGSVGLIAPTDLIGANGQAIETVTIDGLEIEFQLTPGTEAPAEMNLYIPSYQALGVAENATHTLHNILTIRGAEVRDAKKWSDYLNETLSRYGDKSDVLFAQHHWPTWGRERIDTLLSDQRDMYRYIHDQTLRLINHGHTPMEIAETLQSLPPTLAQRWYNRGYYGTMSHNVRAVYQRYLGFYDGNPANLNPLPPTEAATRYVAFMGGEEQVIIKAQKAYDKGDYRWVAEVMKHVVFANPDSQRGRALLANALEQMGYQSEAGTWRNAMLMGASELRHGVPAATSTTASPDTIKAMTLDMFFDYLGIRLNGPKAAEAGNSTLNWVFEDLGETHVMTIRAGALTHRNVPVAEDADATIRLSRSAVDSIILGRADFDTAVANGNIVIDGDAAAVKRFFANLDEFDNMFNIVTP